MSRQRFKQVNLFVFVIFLIGILSACGKASTNTGSESSPSAAPQATAAATATPTATPAAEGSGETTTYTAANGEIKVPKHPKRAVILADSYVGDFLALGIKPVAVPQMAIDNPFFKGMLDGVESLGEAKSIEQVLALKPDLIIAFNGTENLDKFEKIAPTVAIDYGKKTYKEQLLDFGKMTGTEDKANEWIASWDKKIAEAKPKVDAVVGDKTVAILNPYAKGIYVFGHNYGRGGEVIYTELKLKAPQATQKEAIDSGIGWASISLEKLPDYAGDFIFTCPWSGDEGNPKDVYDNVLWKNLPAVKNNKVFEIDGKSSYFNDPISLEGHLKFIVEKLTQQ